MTTSNEEQESVKPSTSTSIKLYACSIILGYAVLEVWNTIITCMYYFQELYKPYNRDPEFTFPLANFFPLLIFQVFMIAYGNRISMKISIVLSIALLSIGMISFFLCCEYIGNMTANFAIAIIFVLILGALGSIAQSAIGGLLGAMGCEGKYIGAYTIGNGISGIFANLMQLLCLLIFGDDDKDLGKSTTLFFAIITLTMLGCTFAGFLTIRDPLAVKIAAEIPKNRSLGSIFKLAWPVFKGQGKNVFMNYVITFMVFPGVMIANTLEFLSKQWSIPVMMLIFNVFDTIGRSLPNKFNVLSSRGTTILTISRILPLIFSCFIGYGVFNGVFVNDWCIIIDFIWVSFTNGLCTTLSIMHGINEEKENKDYASKLLIFFLTVGIFTGSVFAQALFANLF